MDNETSEVNYIKALPVLPVFKISKPSNVADEIKGRQEAEATRDEWSKKVGIRALLHLNQIEETFVSQEVFLSQNFLNEKQGPLKQGACCRHPARIDVSGEKIVEVSDSS